MLNKTLALQLLTATNEKVAKAAGTPLELALRAQARQVENLLGHEEFVAQAKARREAAAQRAADEAKTREIIAQLVARYERDIDEMVAELRHAGVEFDLETAWFDAPGDGHFAKLQNVHDHVKLVWHDRCTIDLTRQV